jgi:hypothetical protein
MATLQLQPCHDNPLPMTDDLSVLHSWAAKYIAEEDALREHGTPFPC